jgi:hypothetical protein
MLDAADLGENGTAAGMAAGVVQAPGLARTSFNRVSIASAV